MLISLLILWPLLGIFVIYSLSSSYKTNDLLNTNLKKTALFFSIVEIVISLIIWFLFDNTSKYFQFVQEQYTVGHYDIYLGLDGLSIYFVLLTTFIISISIISNWKSINENSVYFLIIMLLLESALLLVYSVLDVLMFYVFFESILAPLFILIGLFGSKDKQRAGFYLFLYTLLGSLFMLLSIMTISSLTGSTDINITNHTNYTYITQVFLFIGIFIAFAVKTPVIFLNSWLLKAHVESPLSGSVILAAIVLKLSLYGVFRLILPLVPKASMFYTYIIFVICVITILYASFSTIRTIDIKELIAYSSVSHAVVYLGAVVSNVIQGIQGGILLGLAHGFVSSGLFICAGGILYDRSHTRTIYYYGGLAQIMPIFSILFFILCLGNCGTPLTLNFVGEFMSLYGIFERISLAGMLASLSIVLSAAYTISMFNKISLGGIFKYWFAYLLDLNLREYSLLLILVIFTVTLGIYPSIVSDSLNYVSTNLLYTGVTYNDMIYDIHFEDLITSTQLHNKECLNYFFLYSTSLSSLLFLYLFVLWDYSTPFISMNIDIIEKWYPITLYTVIYSLRLLSLVDLSSLDFSSCPFSEISLQSEINFTLNMDEYYMHEEQKKADKQAHEDRLKRIELMQDANKQLRSGKPTRVIEILYGLDHYSVESNIYAVGNDARDLENLTARKATSPSPAPGLTRGVPISSFSDRDEPVIKKKPYAAIRAPTQYNPWWFRTTDESNPLVLSGGKELTMDFEDNDPSKSILWNVHYKNKFDLNHYANDLKKIEAEKKG